MSNYSLESLQNAIKKHSVCSSPAGGPKYKRQFSSDLRGGLNHQEDEEELKAHPCETEQTNQIPSDDEEVKLEESEDDESEGEEDESEKETPIPYLQSED